MKSWCIKCGKEQHMKLIHRLYDKDSAEIKIRGRCEVCRREMIKIMMEYQT